MSNNNIIIIGSGLGGLSCGVILARNGYNVTVLEQSFQIGGCLQCFSRRGVKFETGMHFVGSASKGQTLDRLFNYLGISKDVQLSQLDQEGYDIISLNGQRFPFANGEDRFVEKLSTFFPKQRDNLLTYMRLVKDLSDVSPFNNANASGSGHVLNAKYQLTSINSVIDSIISDSLLAKVLVGTLPLYAAERDKTPFSTHAFIMNFYNQSAYRIVGGSDAIAKSLSETISALGGKVITNMKVTSILCDDYKATGVVVNESQFIKADYIISDAHPVRTLGMITSKLIRPAFRNRICSIPQTIGVFALYLHFKEETTPYMNHNYYAYSQDTPWGCEHYDDSNWPKGFLYMHFCTEPNPKFARSGVVLSYMNYSDVEKWAGSNIGHRGEDYEFYKKQKAEKLLSSMESHFPHIKESIEHYYTSTPLTYMDYTGTEYGSMYGVAKDVHSAMTDKVPHKTRIPNLFLTGQNINSHGALGVLVGSIVTCGEFVSSQKIYDQINNSCL